MFCAYTRPRYQVSVYRTIGRLAFLVFNYCPLKILMLQFCKCDTSVSIIARCMKLYQLKDAYPGIIR